MAGAQSTPRPDRAEIEAAMQRLQPLLLPGVVITHTRCLGIVEEHYFCRIDRGTIICGHPTPDTIRIRGSDSFADDISPRSVTHINREPIALWLDSELGKIPEPVEPYVPHPEQAKAHRALQLIETNRICDAEAIRLLGELLDDAGPDLALIHYERARRAAEVNLDVPW